MPLSDNGSLRTVPQFLRLNRPLEFRILEELRLLPADLLMAFLFKIAAPITGGDDYDGQIDRAERKSGVS
jgi:hypothetical protein